ARKTLINAGPQNEELLRKIESSVFLLCLDDSSPVTRDEHSTMDGTPTCRLNDYVNTSLALNKIDHGSANVSSNLEAPQKLNFTLNNEVQKAIETSEKNFEELIGQHGLYVQNYEGYGKGLIKKF
ncbi:Carnitine O-acetyltransferase mitochondrial, partial [Entomortierella chlamydospora]